MSSFDDLMKEIEAEAIAEGPDAVKELEVLDEHYKKVAKALKEAGTKVDPEVIQKEHDLEKGYKVDPQSGLGESLIRNGFKPLLLPAAEIEKLFGIKFAEPDNEG